MSGNAANDAALMEVIYAQGWSKSPLYMTKREAEAVTSIGTLFSGNKDIVDFSALKYFTGLISIPAQAFMSCKYLSTIHLPQSIASIGDRAFRGTGLLSLTIPSSVTQINSWRLGGIVSSCKVLHELVVEQGNNHYYSQGNTIYTANGDTLVAGCICSEKIIPNSVKTIGYGAFNGINITDLVLPIGLESVQNICFFGCLNLDCKLPSTLRNIESQAFNNTAITTVDLQNVTDIGSNAFSSCAQLATVNMRNVKKIGPAAFRNCNLLAIVNIDNSIEQIDQNAFNKNSTKSVKTVFNIEAENVPLISEDTFNITYVESINVPASSVDSYKSSSKWSYIASKIQALPQWEPTTSYKPQTQ